MTLPPSLPPALTDYWVAFDTLHGPIDPARFYEAFAFSDNPLDGDALSALVLAGRKRGTATLVWSNEHHGVGSPRPGQLSIVLDGQQRPVCIIETVSLAVFAFADVPEEFAEAEGEGNGSLAHWRAGHWAYFERECARIGRTPTAQMPVVCEIFRLVYAGSASGVRDGAAAFPLGRPA